MNTAISSLFFLFVLTFTAFSENIATDNLSPKDSSNSDSVLTDTTFFNDSIPFDSVTSDTAVPDTLQKDSLRVGKMEKGEIKPIGKNGLGVSFTFMIPIINELKSLRSKKENSEVINHMDQDAEDRFDENDICFPIGLTYRRRLNNMFEIKSILSFYWIKNSNTWTHKEDDTLFTKNHVNSYDFKIIQVSLEAQVNISRALLTVDKFNRLYIAFMVEIFPYVNFKTKRTELNKKINSRGFGYGGNILAGIERYLSERLSFSGEVGYGLGRIYNFKDNGAVKFSDVRVNGNDEDYYMGLRSLRFRFSFCRWF